jgi:hypothetical protein
MARPKKQEVDYFPHFCEHGKVLFILEDRWGNDGYAAFYRLMELLGKTRGHCYDCSNPEGWEYMIAVIRVDEDTVVDILDKLASMQVIDNILWSEKRIWMQSFVDSISDVYVRRKVDLPTKPAPLTELMSAETPLNGNTDDTNPQSKGKEIIVDNYIRQETALDENIILEENTKPKTPPCPHEKIKELYHDVLPELRKVRVWNATRQKILAARWKEDPERQNLDWWKRYFGYVKKCPFLMGKVQNRNGSPPFEADLEWLVRPQNFAKVIEGKYERRN